MPRFNAKRKSLGTLSLSRQNLENLIAVEQKKSAIFQYIQTSVFLLLAAIIFMVAAIILVLNFYAAPVHFSKQGWVYIRNLTPVVTVKTRVDGALEQVFVSQNQIVQKGELLGAVQTDPIKLDYKETQRGFALKVVELHCFVSLQSNKSAFKLPYNAQILVDKMGEQFDVTYRVKQCEREVLRNAITEQAFEESIAAFDDQFRLLQNIVKQHGLGEGSTNPVLENVYETRNGNSPSLQQSQIAKETDESGHDNPLIQLARALQELNKIRKEYFLRRLQKQEKLDSAIQQVTQELRYLNKRLRELNEQLDNNFIYATITGTVVGANIAKPGTFFKKFESVFELQPLENEFQISIPVEEEDVDKFIAGTPATVTLDKKALNNAGQIFVTSVAVLRKPNGKLEAVLDLDGDAKKMRKLSWPLAIVGTGCKDYRPVLQPVRIRYGNQLAISFWARLSWILFSYRPKVNSASDFNCEFRVTDNDLLLLPPTLGQHLKKIVLTIRGHGFGFLAITWNGTGTVQYVT